MDISCNEPTISLTKTIIYSFTAGYMTSQLNILGFVLGCSLMLTINYIPADVKKYNSEIYNNISNFIVSKTSNTSVQSNTSM